MHLKYWHVDDGFIFLAVASRVPTVKLSPLPGYAVIFLVFAPALSLSGSSPRSCKFIRRSKVSVNSQSVAQLSPTRRFHPHFFFSFFFSSGRTIQIRHSVCLDASKSWEPGPVARSLLAGGLPRVSDANRGLERVERNMRWRDTEAVEEREWAQRKEGKRSDVRTECKCC